MKAKFFKVAFLLVALATVFSSCKKDEDSNSKASNFSGPEEYIENPSIKKAIKESRIDVNKGSNPPALAGTYLTDGKIVAASSLFNSLIGLPVNSEFELYDQTTSGKINFREKVGGLAVSGSGGFITGNNGKFTIYLESRQSGSEAGLPNDIAINVVSLMSGSKSDNGNLTLKGLSSISEVTTTNKQYNTKGIEGSWYIWEASFNLQTGLKSAKIRLENGKTNQSIKEIIMRDLIVKIITSE